jgi:hypothetical protein
MKMAAFLDWMLTASSQGDHQRSDRKDRLCGYLRHLCFNGIVWGEKKSTSRFYLLRGGML